MKNFKLIEANINSSHFLKEFYYAQKNKLISDDFGVSTIKTIGEQVFGDADLYAHHESGWIWLVTALSVKGYSRDMSKNSPLLLKTSAYSNFPHTLSFLNKFAKTQNAYLQRVAFATLLPDGDVRPHMDDGKYFKYRDRYHLVLQSEIGSKFTCGNETQIFKEGELWWFANKEVHSVKNLSNSNRIHLIFDLLPKNHYTLTQKIMLFILNGFIQKIYNSFGYEKLSILLDGNAKLKKIVTGLRV